MKSLLVSLLLLSSIFSASASEEAQRVIITARLCVPHDVNASIVSQPAAFTLEMKAGEEVQQVVVFDFKGASYSFDLEVETKEFDIGGNQMLGIEAIIKNQIDEGIADAIDASFAAGVRVQSNSAVAGNPIPCMNQANTTEKPVIELGYVITGQ